MICTFDFFKYLDSDMHEASASNSIPLQNSLHILVLPNYKSNAKVQKASLQCYGLGIYAKTMIQQVSLILGARLSN